MLVHMLVQRPLYVSTETTSTTYLIYRVGPRADIDLYIYLILIYIIIN